MSKSDLQLIIDYYETEKNSVEISLADCVAEGDYQMAKYHSGELVRLDFKLGTLYRLNGTHNILRYPLEFKKRRLLSMLREFPDNPSRRFYIDQVAGIDQQLNDIGLHIKPPALSGQEFDDAVFDVVEGRKTGFRLHLKKEVNLWIDFRSAGNTILLVTITPLQQIKDEDIQYLLPENAFSTIGFQHASATDTWSYSYDTAGFKSAEAIKALSARIIFDIFYFIRLDQPACIEFYD